MDWRPQEHVAMRKATELQKFEEHQLEDEV